MLLLNILLHTADISNPAKPQEIYDKWIAVVLDEFFAQGDREASLGIPVSAGYDRRTTLRAASQINFMEFVVMPLFATLVKIFPELVDLMVNLVENRRIYGAQFDTEIETASFKTLLERQEEKAKMAKRLAAFNTKCGDLPPRLRPRRAPWEQRLAHACQGRRPCSVA